MSASTSKPYSWLRKLPSSLLELDEIPLFGTPPAIDWQQLESELQSALQIKDLTLQSSPIEWTPAEDLYKKLGENTISLKIAIPSMEGAAYWLMTEKDVSDLMSLILQQETDVFKQLDPDFEEGFYTFLGLEAINALAKSGFDPALSPQIQDKSNNPLSDMLCLDLTINLKEKTFLGRLAITPELRKSFKKRYQTAKKESPLSKQIELTVHLEAGSVSLPLSEWKKAIPGDVLILDKCSLQPGSDKGRIILTIHGHPFFRGKVKDGNIKILEHPLYYETEKAMDRLPPDEDDEDFSFEEDEDEEEWGEEEEEEEEDEGEDEEIEDEEIEEEEGEEKAEKVEAAPERHITAGESPEEKKKAPTKPEEITLPIVVEVGRLQMAVQTLMELEPGNILDLNVHPESGVDIVVNGNRIGKGELIQIGDLLGVRILEMG